ncbi:TPA: hypothetical protein GXZ54_01510 [bacterium]|nr:hypothetical protein [bacterium]
MNKVFVLTKVLFKNAFLASNKIKLKNVIITFSIVGILLIASYVVPVVMGIGEFVSWLAPVVDPSILLEMFLPSIVFVLFLMSVIAIISYYYLSTDISLLLPMPFKSKEILLARFILVTLSLYFFEFFFFGPVLIGYGVGSGAGLFYYVYMLIFLLTAPFIPISIMSIIITSLMRFGNLSASKDRFTYIVMFLSLAFGLGFSMIPTTIEFDINPAEFASLINELQKVTNYVVPFLRPAINALKDSSSFVGLLWFILYLAISVGVVCLFLLVSSNVYIKGVMEGGNGKKKAKRHQLDTNKSIKKGSAFKSYVLKEWRLIFRTPVYNTNLVLVELILVVIFAGSFIFGLSAEGGDISKVIAEITSFKLSSQLNYVFFFIMAGILFFNGISLVSSTAISREGKAAYFMKYIPMSPIKQINAKIFIGIIIHLLLPVIALFATLVLGVIDIFQFFYILIPLVLLSVFLNYWGILLDIAKPKLNWDNETVAVKQNFNGVLFMIICYSLAIIFIAFALTLLFIDNIRKAIHGFIIGLIPTLVGSVLLIVSILLILNFVKKIKSLAKWMILLNIFTLLIILGGILTFGGIMEFVHYLYQVNAGIGIWSIVITIALGLATYILVKSISLKGDAIFDNID